MKCLRCAKITNNPLFCSRSCAAILNNIRNPKRRKSRKAKCKKCKKEYIMDWQKKSVFCPEHYRSQKQRVLDAKDKRIGDLRNAPGNNKLHRSAVNAAVRNYGRKWNSHREAKCQSCGYDKHVEYCHIKQVSDFKDSDTLWDVNNPKNILILCRNCHWEYDNGLISFKNGPGETRTL